jgi:DNA-binding beta-propeller fold protein YncE
VGRVDGNFEGIAVDPVTDLVYVANPLDGTVSIIDGAICDGTHTAGCDETPPTVPVDGSPAGVVVDESDHDVYAAGGVTASFFSFQSPAAPSGVTATDVDGEVKLVWQPPADGGLPMIYTVTPTPACPACSGLSTPSTSAAPYTTIGGLQPGQTYTFKVRATNAAGTGTASTPSSVITP